MAWKTFGRLDAHKKTRRQLGIETLDSRQLMASDLAPSIVPPSSTAPSSPASSAVHPQADGGARVSRQIVFIDHGVVNREALLSEPVVGEVAILTNDRNGLSQIADFVRGRTGIEAIHIVSHGRSGEVALGDSVLDLKSVAGRDADAIRAIREVLTSDADLNFYACDLASDEAGLALLEELATQTGADVAASTNPTGTSTLGGDWVLEAMIGRIEHGTPFADDARSAYSATLGLPRLRSPLPAPRLPSLPGVSLPDINSLLKLNPRDAAQRLAGYDVAKRVAAFNQMTADQASKIIWEFDWDKMTETLNNMTPSRAADVIWRYDWDRAIRSLDHMTAGRAAELIWTRDWGNMITALNKMSAGRAADLIWTYDWNRVISSLDHMTAGRAAELIWTRDWNNMTAALNRMSAGRAADLIWTYDWNRVVSSLNHMTAGRAAELIWTRDWANRLSALDKMSAGRAAEVLLNRGWTDRLAALNKMSASRAADVIWQCDWNHLKETLNRLDISRVGAILSTRTVNQRLSVLKTMNAGQAASIVATMNTRGILDTLGGLASGTAEWLKQSVWGFSRETMGVVNGFADRVQTAGELIKAGKVDVGVSKLVEAAWILIRDEATVAVASAINYQVDYLIGVIGGTVCGRALTAGEKEFAHRIFGNQINLTHVRVVNFAYTGIAAANVVYIKGGMDLRNNATRKLFAHELTHIHQDQALYGPDTTTATRENLNHWFGSGTDPYKLNLSARTTWNSLGAEQQAKLVENYQSFLDIGSSSVKPDWMRDTTTVAHYKRILGEARFFGLR